jgi:hypothetical protein
MRACVKTEREVGEDDKPENHIQPFEPGRPRHKRRGHDENYCYRVESKEGVTKSMRNTAFAEI